MKSWVSKNADRFVLTFIPAPDRPELKPNECYVRLWLADMFLKRDRQWFEDRYPMVHASLQLSYAGQQASFTTVARAPEGALAPGERRNYPLSPLLPWRGGVIEVEAGLSGLPGKNLLAPVLDVLGDLSKLVAPPLSSALAVVNQVGAAVDGLLTANNEPVVLGLHEAFAAQGAGARQLQAGHLAVVAASPAELPPSSLSIVDGVLHTNSRPLTAVDHMLIEVSGLIERDDWRFPALDETIASALNAILVHDNREEFERYRDAALSTVLTSTDLTPLDRTRVALAIRSELAAADGKGEGLVGDQFPTLDAIVAYHAPTVAEARTLPKPTLESLLAPM